MMEALLSSETSVLIRATRRKIPEGGILHSHRRDNLKSYLFDSLLTHPVIEVDGQIGESLSRTALLVHSVLNSLREVFIYVMLPGTSKVTDLYMLLPSPSIGKKPSSAVLQIRSGCVVTAGTVKPYSFTKLTAGDRIVLYNCAELGQLHCPKARIGKPGGSVTSRNCTQVCLCMKQLWGRMASSGMLRRVALVRTDISEELSASIIRVLRLKLFPVHRFLFP
jgi:hypothetical protein